MLDKSADEQQPDESEAQQAAAVLVELDDVSARARTMGLATTTGTPMIVWGIAWIAQYVGLALLPLAPALAVVALTCAIASALSWRTNRGGTRTNRRPLIRRGWLVIFGSSPLLVFVAQPASVEEVALLVGAIWGLAFLLYAVAVEDAAPFVVGLIVVVAATVASTEIIGSPLIFFGVVGGTSLLVLGVRRG